MFNFFGMIDDYEQRKVGRYEEGSLLVSTCAVNNSEDPYETAVYSPLYNSGEAVIVAIYATKAEAEIGHAKWAALMIDSPPDKLVEVSRTGVSLLKDLVYGNELWREKPSDD